MQAASIQQTSTNSTLRNYCILLLICLLAYWPLTTGIFSLKNDALHYFLPFRYQISCSLREGNLPFWSPYIYNGFPIHGDLQSGAWNPAVWLFSLFGSYDITLFHIEYLFYLFLSGVGMYQLSSLISKHPTVRLFCATAYMLCGYMTGSGQFVNWIASAAFIPFILYAYYQLLNTAKWKYALYTAVFLWLLFVSGYTADVIYTGYILLAIFITGLFIAKRSKISFFNRNYILLHLLLLVVFLGLSAPALISFVQIRPLYLRGSGISFGAAVSNPYELKNYISLFSPWAVSAQDYTSSTNITGRNIFIGIISLYFVFVSFLARQNKITIFLVLLAIFSFLFSLGDAFPLRKLAYDFIPGMNVFRHPSHFRLYIIIPLLLLAANGLITFNSPVVKKRTLVYLQYILLAIPLVLAFISLLKNKDAVFLNRENLSITNPAEWFLSLKADMLLFWSLLIQTGFCLMLLILLRKEKFPFRMILVLHISNFLLFQSLLPVTFFGRTSAKEINTLIHAAAKEKPATDKTLFENSANSFAHYFNTGIHSFYEKKPSLVYKVYNPSALTSHKEFIKNKILYEEIGNKPVAYLSDSTSNPPGMINARIGWNTIYLDITAHKTAWLYLTQNYSTYWSVTVDDVKNNIELTQLTFMRTQIKKGTYKVIFTYNPPGVRTIFYISLIFLFFSLFLLIYLAIRKCLKKE